MPFLSQRALRTSITALSTASGAGAILYYKSQPKPPSNVLPSNNPHQTMPISSFSPYTATFSVALSCSACITSIDSALSTHLPNYITSTSFSIPSNLVTITSTAAPSAIISAIQSTGRDAILRGSGEIGKAGVCILEVPPQQSWASVDGSGEDTNNRGLTSAKLAGEGSPVRGLARLIQLSDTLTLLDLTLTSLPEGRYRVSVRQTGDVSHGSGSLGSIYRGEDGSREGEMGVLEVDGKGRGSLIGEVGWRVWELVGRGMCVEPLNGGTKKGEVVGVIARSAGVWENEKVVCGCSGKTVWEEREEMVGKGMV
ncbi:MAG: hypothetical protein Q9220_001048 [cf. Caloplaca sp. 1 TL-2023]